MISEINTKQRVLKVTMESLRPSYCTHGIVIVRIEKKYQPEAKRQNIGSHFAFTEFGSFGAIHVTLYSVKSHRSVRIKQLQEFLKSDHWLRRYCILSGGVFYSEPPCSSL